MGFQKRIKYFLVHSLSFTNRQAQALISEGRVEINGQPVYENCFLEPMVEIKIDQVVVRPAKIFTYLKFHKPPGFQSSLNREVNNNLAGFFGKYPGLSIAGRLDQQSEGLLLLSDNGKWVEEICNPLSEKEKEYLVTVDRDLDEKFCIDFAGGVNIGNYITKACQCKMIGANQVNVVLREGKNRQIRRMCAALGYRVTALKRTRIDRFELGNLAAGESVPF
jgi:23S rRNA pseudouridine2604 synthase